MAMNARVRSALLLACCLIATAPDAGAQSLGITPGRDQPEWLGRWSPLNDAGTLPRLLWGAGPAVPSLLYPMPRVGLFWTGANPAGLAWETEGQLNELRLARAGQSGSYRRSMDPTETSVTRFSGMGWQSAGVGGGVAGGLLFDRSDLDPSSISNVNNPYSSNPLVVTDSSFHPLEQTRVRLEGAGGWRIGGWGFGGALGYDTRATRTVGASLVRRNREVIPAAVVGVVREFRPERLYVGVRAGYQGGEETINIIALGTTGVVYQLEGLREVPRFPIGAEGYYRRSSREVLTGGVGATGASGNVRWTAHADGVRRDERLTNQRADDPPVDLWQTRGSRIGAVAQFPIPWNRGVLTLAAHRVALTGEAVIHPDRGGLSTEESELRGSAELWLSSADGEWCAVIRGLIMRERREWIDSAADATSLVEATTPELGLEVGQRLSPRWSLIAGFSFSRYGGTGAVPAPDLRGPVYQRIIAPEIDIATSTLRASAFTGGVTWRAGAETLLWLAGRAESLSSNTGNRPFAPSGSRSARSLMLGVTTQRAR